MLNVDEINFDAIKQLNFLLFTSKIKRCKKKTNTWVNFFLFFCFTFDAEDVKNRKICGLTKYKLSINVTSYDKKSNQFYYNSNKYNNRLCCLLKSIKSSTFGTQCCWRFNTYNCGNAINYILNHKLHLVCTQVYICADGL